ncbi:HIT-like domain-containing protein [Thamnocephalis sphaerospora]|uniref:HIT-like domain-containing protein n=1 Tax=Thamnocephalis sphaerospora TaxID=78915 RepID=A0A4P9XKG8_9FUNG|nr:HIT-like domain-containing protein [Thamnocephalis sphaerospora]|eukprot:RKP06265.1 HIT-like domain-containing protein [Thamnocephalis sphaerospora]
MDDTFETQVRQVHEQALSSGALIFTPTKTETLYQAGAAFEVRLAPSLAKKPVAGEAEVAQRSKPWKNPFLPYDERLLVKTLREHVILLNKFCVVPGHILVPQTDPLNASDFAAVWSCFRQTHIRHHVAFYNCGPASGASQPHKHIQLLPLPAEQTAPPIGALIEETPSVPGKLPIHSLDRVYVPFRIARLEFVHACARLSSEQQLAAVGDTTATTVEEQDAVVGRYLHRIFLSLMHASQLAGALSPDEIALRASATSTPSTPLAKCPPVLSPPAATRHSYNVVLTREFMLVVPRKHDRAQGIAINALGFAGLLLAKSSHDLSVLHALSVPGLLRQLAFASPAEMTDNHAEEADSSAARDSLVDADTP